MGLHHHLSTDETELIRDCRAGHPAAQRRLYDRYVQAMYNRVLRMVADRHLTEDILQEVFLKVFRYLASYKGEASLGAWIKRIAINTTIEHLRSRRRIEYVDELPEYGLVGHAKEETSGPKLSPKEVQQAIQQLPEGARLVVTLFLIEGYQHKEIAQILNITESTSKTQYRRGKQLLRKLLRSKIIY